MQWFYDHQLKRYITQLIRMFSGFKYRDGDGEFREVPVLYGDLTRQVGAILRDNSENKIPSAPRMALYIGRLVLDKDRLADATFVSKTHIRERAISDDGTEYLDMEGRNYTVERLMPTPYELSVNLDIWSTNTDQKLQLLEQILMLFNPSLELQTTDNYIDWASISTVYLDDISWSSRSIPTGTETEIDVATLSFSLPIYISPPVKVKRLGVITDIITRIQETNYAGSGDSYTDLSTGFEIDNNGNIIPKKTKFTTISNEDSSQTEMMGVVNINYDNSSLVVSKNAVELQAQQHVNWNTFIDAFPGRFIVGVSQLRLKRYDWPYEVVGTFMNESTNSNIVDIQWDYDTYPEDTDILGPNGYYNKIDYIIDPLRTSPATFLDASERPRILILNDVGDEDNADGPNAWKSIDGDDFTAKKNDLIEWDGSQWSVVYSSAERLCVYNNQTIDTVFASNLNTGMQYKFYQGEWVLSIDGEYPPGSWRLIL